MAARYLVVQLARFGDLLQTRRLILSLARHGQVHLCVDTSLAGLASSLYPGVVVHGVHAHAGGGRDARRMLADNISIFSELKEISFSRVYNLNVGGMNLALSTLFDPATVRGHAMAHGQALPDPWAAMAMRWTRRRIASPLNLADFWAWFADEPFGDGETAAVGPIAPDLVNPAPAPSGGGLGVVLAGRESRRSLPVEILAPCVQALADGAACGQGRGRIVLLGTEAERPLGRQLMAVMRPALRERTENLAGRTSYTDLVEVVSGLDAIWTPDTGTMHLAAFLGTPVIASFLSSAWAWETGPYGAGHTVWQSVEPCAPCVETQPCPHDVACLRPYAEPGFLRALATGSLDSMPSGLCCLSGGFDALGAVWDVVAGQDPAANERRALRSLLAGYLVGTEAGEAWGAAWAGLPQSELARLAETLFRERDWMLPSRQSEFRSIC